MDKEDPYEVLGISQTADETEVKEAYRELVKEYHPDQGGSSEEFKKINWAYNRISSDSFDEYIQNTQSNHRSNFGTGHDYDKNKDQDSRKDAENQPPNEKKSGFSKLTRRTFQVTIFALAGGWIGTYFDIWDGTFGLELEKSRRVTVVTGPGRLPNIPIEVSEESELKIWRSDTLADYGVFESRVSADDLEYGVFNDQALGRDDVDTEGPSGMTGSSYDLPAAGTYYVAYQSDIFTVEFEVYYEVWN